MKIKLTLLLVFFAAAGVLSAQPVQPTPLSPADGATAVVLNPTLDWDTLTADSFSVQVSVMSNFSSSVLDTILTDTATKFTVPSGLLAHNTTYYWRVAAYDMNGTSPYSNTLHFTTLVAPPAMVTLKSPADNETLVSLSNTYLKWDSAAGATNYKIRLATDMNMTNLLLDTTIGKMDSVRIANGKLSPLTDYYWSVASGVSNSFSAWSAPFKFTSTGLPPAAPQLVSPMSASLNLGKNPTLTWAPVSGATAYHVVVSTFNNFADSTFDAVVNAPTVSKVVTTNLDAYTVYFWRVAAENAYGISEWSLFWNFTTLYTGLNDVNQDAFGMNVYPNPAKGNRTVSFDLKKEGPVAIVLTDIAGKQVMNISNTLMQSGFQEVSFSTETLGAGVYMLSITQDGTAQTIKVIVQ